MDPFVAIKSQMWNRWFQSAIPMLDNQTPIEAAKTPRGRKKLNKLLAFYDKMSAGMSDDGSSPNFNVPTKYAKWELGYGQGSPQEYILEEFILNYQSYSQQRPTVWKVILAISISILFVIVILRPTTWSIHVPYSHKLCVSRLIIIHLRNFLNCLRSFWNSSADKFSSDPV